MKKSSPQPILCGTDFSDAAARAANVAAAFAVRLDAPLLLVHGVDERGDIAPFLWPSLTEESRPTLHQEAERLRKSGATVEEIVSAGVPDEGVAYCAERADARMIVLASSGHSAFDRWTLGSVSERVAESAWAPTLVVRQTARLEEWARGGKPLRVFVGADFTAESEAAMSWAAELREIGPCEYTLGFVDRPASESPGPAPQPSESPAPALEAPEAFVQHLRGRAANYFPRQSTHVRVLPASGRVDSHLLELASEACAELIVVGTHQWHGLSRLRHVSVSRRILRAAHVSVACVPAHRVVSAMSPTFSKAHRVLVTTDLSTHDSVAIPYAFSMLQRGGTASFLHVVRPGEAPEVKLEQLRALIPGDALAHGFQVNAEVVAAEDVATAICEARRRLDADLICIGARDFSKNPAARLGSTTRDVIARSSCPVLVVPPQTF
jgi:nucleotide-binding universal stress UspA family protein